MAKQLSKSNSPVFEVFELVKQGKSDKEIKDVLDLTTYKLRDIKKTKTYQELKEEYYRESSVQADLFQSHLLDKYSSIMDEVTNKLIDLTNSENEKVSLEACKFIIDRYQRLYESKQDGRLAQLESMVTELLESREAIAAQN